MPRQYASTQIRSGKTAVLLKATMRRHAAPLSENGALPLLLLFQLSCARNTARPDKTRSAAAHAASVYGLSRLLDGAVEITLELLVVAALFLVDEDSRGDGSYDRRDSGDYADEKPRIVFFDAVIHNYAPPVEKIVR